MAEEKTKRYSLDKPLCQDNTEVQSAEYTDHYINGVTYRVWSAFEGKTNVADSLSRLMFRKLESGEQVGEVVDEFQKGIERINNSSLVQCKISIIGLSNIQQIFLQTADFTGIYSIVVIYLWSGRYRKAY